MAVVFGFTLALTGCENGNLFGGLNGPTDGGSIENLNANASLALRNRDYSLALSLYNQVLTQNPNNSEALLGSSAAQYGLAGLNFGTIVSNLIHQSGGVASTGLADVITQARESVSASSTDPNSVLANIDLDRLNSVIDCIVYRLHKIVAGAADGTISENDVDVLLNFGFTCIIRAILKPLREGWFDLVNDNGDLNPSVVSATAGTFCMDSANDEFISTMGKDMAGAYALLNEAITQLGTTSSDSILVEIRGDIDSAVTTALTSGGPNALPNSCINKISSLAGITKDNFRSVGATLIRQAPATDPCTDLE